MLTKVFKIKNKMGIHARPASLLVKTASRYKSSVYISKNSQEVNGKSIMGILMLEAGYGSEITVRVDGKDEKKALEALEKIIVEDQFNEE